MIKVDTHEYFWNNIWPTGIPVTEETIQKLRQDYPQDDTGISVEECNKRGARYIPSLHFIVIPAG